MRDLAVVDAPVRAAPRFYARTAGLLYLYIVFAGTFAEVFVRGRLVDVRDASATAELILRHERLLRLGATAELLHLACDVAVTVILYSLLQPVHRPVALLTAFLRFACIVVLATASVTQFAALRLLRPTADLDALGEGPRQALALLAMQLHADGYTISLLFFGFGCVSLGYLIHRSTYLPRVLGAFMALAGACYLVNSVAQLLRLGIASKLFPALFIPIFVAELSLSLWLLARGVRVAEFRRVVEATEGPT